MYFCQKISTWDAEAQMYPEFNFRRLPRLRSELLFIWIVMDVIMQSNLKTSKKGRPGSFHLWVCKSVSTFQWKDQSQQNYRAYCSQQDWLCPAEAGLKLHEVRNERAQSLSDSSFDNFFLIVMLIFGSNRSPINCLTISNFRSTWMDQLLFEINWNWSAKQKCDTRVTCSVLLLGRICVNRKVAI